MLQHKDEISLSVNAAKAKKNMKMVYGETLSTMTKIRNQQASPKDTAMYPYKSEGKPQRLSALAE